MISIFVFLAVPLILLPEPHQTRIFVLFWNLLRLLMFSLFGKTCLGLADLLQSFLGILNAQIKFLTLFTELFPQMSPAIEYDLQVGFKHLSCSQSPLFVKTPPFAHNTAHQDSFNGSCRHRLLLATNLCLEFLDLFYGFFRISLIDTE